MRAVFCTALALASLNIYGQERSANPIPVFVVDQCDDDSVGQRIAYKIREGLRESSRMGVADTYLDSLIRLALVCLEPASGDSGHISRYSYAVTVMNTGGEYDYLLAHGVGMCGTNRVNECAEDRVAEVDKAIAELRVSIKKGNFKFKDD